VNDVFISYSHEDSGWAQKLHQLLTAAGINTYLDAARLQAGQYWEQSLATEVNASRSLVVLYSNAAQRSNWVQREVGLFDGYTLADPKRRLIYINLEGEDQSRVSLQHINDLRTLGLYAGGADKVDQNTWDKVVRRIKSVIEDNDDAVRIAVAVLTLTKNDVADPATSKLDFDEIQRTFQLDAAAVQRRYADDRLDWNPYGEAVTIRTTLNQLIDSLSQASGKRFRWRAAPDGLWDDATIDEAVVEVVNAPLSLVVVDTLALKHEDVYRTMTQLREFLKRSLTCWLLFPPTASDPRMLSYHSVIKRWSSPLLRDYFEPPIPPDVMAPQFGVHCGDSNELQRMVRLAAGAYIVRSEGSPKVAFTQYR
jgi:TIR domain-containing protein